MNAKTNKLLHALLTQKGLAHRKADIISGITNGRTDSSTALTEAEASDFIDWLQTQVTINPLEGGKATQAAKKDWTPPTDEANDLRKKFIGLAYGYYSDDHVNRLKAWCLVQGKKKFNEYTVEKLKELIKGFKSMVSQSKK